MKTKTSFCIVSLLVLFSIVFFAASPAFAKGGNGDGGGHEPRPGWGEEEDPCVALDNCGPGDHGRGQGPGDHGHPNCNAAHGEPDPVCDEDNDDDTPGDGGETPDDGGDNPESGSNVVVVTQESFTTVGEYACFTEPVYGGVYQYAGRGFLAFAMPDGSLFIIGDDFEGTILEATLFNCGAVVSARAGYNEFGTSDLYLIRFKAASFEPEMVALTDTPAVNERNPYMPNNTEILWDENSPISSGVYKGVLDFEKAVINEATFVSKGYDPSSANGAEYAIVSYDQYTVAYVPLNDPDGDYGIWKNLGYNPTLYPSGEMFAYTTADWRNENSSAVQYQITDEDRICGGLPTPEIAFSWDGWYAVGLLADGQLALFEKIATECPVSFGYIQTLSNVEYGSFTNPLIWTPGDLLSVRTSPTVDYGYYFTEPVSMASMHGVFIYAE